MGVDEEEAIPPTESEKEDSLRRKLPADDGDSDNDEPPSRHERHDRSRSPLRDGGSREKRKDGTACRWNTRGFGFIKQDDGGEDLFVHVSEIKDGNCLEEGNKVTYEVIYDDTRQKYRAQNVSNLLFSCKLIFF